ncbi:MAG: T9SS type A sorting domain-containing protein, partial [Bacteroidota bacterium]
PDYTYYYIDDVCLTSDSLYNENWTGLSEIKHETKNILIYPNPADNYISIWLDDHTSEIDATIIFDVMGKQIVNYENIKKEKLLKINISNLPSSIYLIEVIDNTGKRFTTKFIKE